MSNSIVIGCQLVTIPVIRNPQADSSKQVALGLIQIEEKNQCATIPVIAFGAKAVTLSQEDLNTHLIIEGSIEEVTEQNQDGGYPKKYLQIIVSNYHVTNELVKVNTVNLLGRTGSDPDVKYFESGSAVAKVSIAVKRASKSDKPDWIKVAAWNNEFRKMADTWANYVRKGTELSVTGSLSFSIGKNGQTYWEVNCQKFAFAGSKGDSQSQSSASTSSPQSNGNGKVLVASVASAPAVDSSINLEDIPY